MRSTVVVEAKPWWASRTILLNVLGFVVLVLGIILESAGQLGISGKLLAWLGIVLAICNALLRLDTSAPIGRSGEMVEVDGSVVEEPMRELSPGEMLAIARYLRELGLREAEVQDPARISTRQVAPEVPGRG